MRTIISLIYNYYNELLGNKTFFSFNFRIFLKSLLREKKKHIEVLKHKKN